MLIMEIIIIIICRIVFKLFKKENRYYLIFKRFLKNVRMDWILMCLKMLEIERKFK